MTNDSGIVTSAAWGVITHMIHTQMEKSRIKGRRKLEGAGFLLPLFMYTDVLKGKLILNN